MKRNRVVPICALTTALVVSSASAFADGTSFKPRPLPGMVMVSASPQLLPATYLVYASAAVALVANSPKAYAVTVEAVAAVAEFLSSSSSSSGGVAADPSPKADEFD